MSRTRRLLRYAAAHRAGWAFILAVTLASSVFSLLQPWPMQVLVDNVLGRTPLPSTLARAAAWLPGASTPKGLLTWVALAGLAIFALNSAVGVILTWAWVRVGQRMVYDLAEELFAHVIRRSLLFHSRSEVGDLMSRIMGDSWCVHTVVDTLLFAPGHALILLVGMVTVMARMDPGLTLLSLAVAPFLASSAWILGKPLGLVARAQREIESRIQSHVQQILSGIPVVQAFTREEAEHRRFQEFTQAAIRAKQRSALAGGFYNLGSGLITTLGTAAVLWVGARHVLDGRLTVGALLVFLTYLGSLQVQLNAFSGIHSVLQGAGASIDRVMEVLEPDQEVKDRPGAPPLPALRGHLRFENVTFGYEVRRPVLRGVSLEVAPGQTLAVVGPTGAGKTTLVSLVPRFFDPWEGRVTLDGHDLRDVQLKSLREQVALVLQEPFLFPVTIAENIAYGKPGATQEEVKAAAKAANAHAFIERLPEGYETRVGERGATLSGGERQRLSIARALLKDAPVLILDEPTSALDAETEGLLLEALERLMEGRTTLIIAHRLSTVRRADRIVVLEGGEVVEAGTHAELLARPALYARFHRAQFGAETVPSGGRA